MSSISKVERRIIINSGSPLKHHSLDQETLKREREGSSKLAATSQLSGLSKRRKLMIQYESEKILRVAERVRFCCTNDNTIPASDLVHQMRYLRHHGFNLQWLKYQAEPIIPIPLSKL